MDRITSTALLLWMAVMLIPISGETDLCEEPLLSLSPCLPFIAGPPNDGRWLSYPPPGNSCCRPLRSAAAYHAGNVSGPCLCLLFRNPMLFGFPVEVEKMRTMMDYCLLNKKDCEGIEDGSPTPPPIGSPLPSPPSHRPQKASSSRAEGGSLIALAVLGAISMAVEPIVMICSGDFHLGTAVIHFLNMLCYLLLAWYGLPNISDDNVPLSVANIIRAALEVAILLFHISKTPSRKDVADLLTITTIGSLVFCTCFYYIEKTLNVDGKKGVFGYAPVGFSAILMIPPVLDLRREMIENPLSIGCKDGCRIGGGCTASIIWMLYGLLTSSPDYPTIVGGAVGLIGAVIQLIMMATVRVFDGGNMDEPGNQPNRDAPANQPNRDESEEENDEDEHHEDEYFSCVSGSPENVNN